VTTTPRPGWYPDPAGDPSTPGDPSASGGAEDLGGGFRWWDGSTWTEDTADHAYAPSPQDTVVAGPSRPRSRLVRVVAWTVVVALVLTTSAGALLLLWSGPQTAEKPEPETAASVGGQLDERARRATIKGVTMDLPPSPYKVSGGAHEVPGVLDVVFIAEAKVHPRTSEHPGWTAMVCLAAVDDRLAGGLDLDADSEATLKTLAGKIYGNAQTQIRDVDVAEHSVDGHGGVRISAEVHYEIQGLPSQYDDLTAILIRLDDGSVVAALSSVPDDASDEVRDLADDSLSSLRVN
jgi:hypothetical protein